MMTDLITLRETSPEDIRLLLDTAQSFKEILERPVKKVPTLRQAGGHAVLRSQHPHARLV